MAQGTRMRKHDPRKQPQSVGPIRDTKSGNRTGIDSPAAAAPEGPARAAKGRSPKAKVVR